MAKCQPTAKKMKKEEREACWQAKDVLFQCLDQNKEDIKQCEVEYLKLKNLCPESWVSRFIGKRKFDSEKDEIIKKWGDKYVEERRQKVRESRQKRKEKEKANKSDDDDL